MFITEYNTGVSGVGNHQKPPQSGRLLSKLYSLLGTHLIALVGFSILINLLQLTIPIYMMQVFDRVLPGRSVDTLTYLTMIAVIALLSWGALMAIRQRVLVSLSHWLDSQLGRPLFQESTKKILKGDMYALQSMQDLSEVRNFSTSPGAVVLFDIPWIPIYILIVYFLHPLLGVVVTAGAALLFLLTYWHEQKMRPLVEQAHQASMIPRQIHRDTLAKSESATAMGMNANLADRWETAQEQAVDPSEKVAHQSGHYLATVRTFRMILQLSVLGIGGYLAMQGVITGGGMIAASIIGGRALQPVEQLTGAWANLLKARGAFDRLEHFLSEMQPVDGISLPEPKGRLQIQGLIYQYPGAEKPTVMGVEFQSEPGVCTAIIGPSGCGKTTVLKNVIGVFQPTKGHVRLDSAEIHKWSSDERGEHVGYVSQQVDLFPGTIAENIARMGLPDQEKVLSAAEMAGAHQLILHLPNGYETKISQMGSGLSGGQIQRIALARALYGAPKLVVLDEPGSNLDQKGIAALQKAISLLKKNGSTVVLTTHQQALIAIADQLVVLLEDGRPLMRGPRDLVLQKLQEQKEAKQ